MDPKALASLDPKLRETYEKVMGTSTTPSPQTSASANSTPASKTYTPLPGLIKARTQAQPTQTPPITAPSSPLSSIPPPVSPLAVPNNPTLQNHSINSSPVITAQSPLQTQDFATLQATPTGIPLPTAQGSPVQLGKAMQPLPSPASINKSVAPSGNSSPIIRFLYIIASIIFFAVYTIFWLKIFKYPMPWLPF